MSRSCGLVMVEWSCRCGVALCPWRRTLWKWSCLILYCCCAVVVGGSCRCIVVVHGWLLWLVVILVRRDRSRSSLVVAGEGRRGHGRRQLSGDGGMLGWAAGKRGMEGTHSMTTTTNIVVVCRSSRSSFVLVCGAGDGSWLGFCQLNGTWGC